jgi:hypothetical protein
VKITLDRQVLSKRCPGCDLDFTVVRGSIFDEPKPIGLYLIALHGHSPAGRLAHVALAILGPDQVPLAAALDMVERQGQFGYTAVNWSESPWKDERYLGVMLDRDAALSSPLKSVFFLVAGHIASDLPEVQRYFS